MAGASVAGSMLGHLSCKAGWWDQLFVSTKCIRLECRMAYPRLELIHWKRGLLLNVLKREEAWFVFQWLCHGGWCAILSQVWVRGDSHSGKMVILNILLADVYMHLITWQWWRFCVVGECWHCLALTFGCVCLRLGSIWECFNDITQEKAFS